MTALVELAVIGQMHLRDDAEQPAAMDGKRAIVKPPGVAQRRTDEDERHQSLRGANQPIDCADDTVMDGALQEKIVDRIARDREFRKDRERHRLLMQG